MKHVRILILVAALALALPGAALAEHLTGGTGWDVTFNSNARMQDNFSDTKWADDIRSLQPGDDITFTVALHHKHPTSADWYMSNEVLKSLEEGVAAGSAYGYYLTYTNPKGTTRVLYDSERVGGDDTEGLLDATSALDEYFYLDNLSQNDDAHVDLVVSLDGETEGNAYFDTLAQLRMRFAVELNSSTKTNDPNPPSSTTTSTRTMVRTGDDTDLFPFFVAMAVSGALLMVLAGDSVRRRKKEEKEAAR